MNLYTKYQQNKIYEQEEKEKRLMAEKIKNEMGFDFVDNTTIKTINQEKEYSAANNSTINALQETVIIYEKVGILKTLINFFKSVFSIIVILSIAGGIAVGVSYFINMLY